jgi:hypothetical protein
VSHCSALLSIWLLQIPSKLAGLAQAASSGTQQLQAAQSTLSTTQLALAKEGKLVRCRAAGCMPRLLPLAARYVCCVERLLLALVFHLSIVVECNRQTLPVLYCPRLQSLAGEEAAASASAATVHSASRVGCLAWGLLAQHGSRSAQFVWVPLNDCQPMPGYFLVQARQRPR